MARADLDPDGAEPQPVVLAGGRHGKVGQPDPAPAGHVRHRHGEAGRRGRKEQLGRLGPGVGAAAVLSGSSTASSNCRAETRHRYPPSQRAVSLHAMTADAGAGPTPAPLPAEVRVVNVGLPLFADAVRAQGAAAVEVDWRIPAGGRPGAGRRAGAGCTARPPSGSTRPTPRCCAGSTRARRCSSASRPRCEVVPGMDDRTSCTADLALAWADFCDPLRRSVRAAVVAEGWAGSPEEAERLVAAGEVRLEPANHHGAVVPMATAVGPSAPVLVVEDPQTGGRGLLGQSTRGRERPPGSARRHPAGGRAAGAACATSPRRCWRPPWPRPGRSTCSRSWPGAADGRRRPHADPGGHQPVAPRTCCRRSSTVDHPAGRRSARFLSGNHLFFLNLAMAAAKVRRPSGPPQVQGSSVVVGMARNGTTFGIRLAGTGTRWFVAPAPPVGRRALPPRATARDERPRHRRQRGARADRARRRRRPRRPPRSPPSWAARWPARSATTEAMDRICVGRSSRFTLPLLDFRGTPLGVDVRKVVELRAHARRSTPASSTPATAPGRSAPASPRHPSTASARRSWRWTGVWDEPRPAPVDGRRPRLPPQTVQVLSWNAPARQAVSAESSTSSGLKALTPDQVVLAEPVQRTHREAAGVDVRALLQEGLDLVVDRQVARGSLPCRPPGTPGCRRPAARPGRTGRHGRRTPCERAGWR